MIQLSLFPARRFGIGVCGMVHDVYAQAPMLFKWRSTASRVMRRMPEWMFPECARVVRVDVHGGDVPTLVVHA